MKYGGPTTTQGERGKSAGGDCKGTGHEPVYPWIALGAVFVVGLLSTPAVAIDWEDGLGRAWQPDRDEGDFYVLSVGVEPEMTANGTWDPYARDARYVGDLFAAETTPYASTHVRVLSGARATRGNVLSGLEWLAESTRPQDVALVFFSTHGDLDAQGRYYISLAVDTASGGANARLWGKELGTALSGVEGRSVLLLDTCASGGVLTTRPDSLAVIGASGADEESDGQWQRPDRPHGWFVIALCEALAGRADADRSGVVTLEELAAYLPDRARWFWPDQNAVMAIPPLLAQLALSSPVDAAAPTLWPVVEKGPRRNPFGVRDVPCPQGEDVQIFAQHARLDGRESDPNARDWPADAVIGTGGSLDGAWASRWRGTEGGWERGSAKLRTVGADIFVLFDDVYLIEARRVGEQQLVGRYVNLEDASDSSPWVGRVVAPDRIDGSWSGGRWDFRRRLLR